MVILAPAFRSYAHAAAGWVSAPLANPVAQSGQATGTVFGSVDGDGNSLAVWRREQGGVGAIFTVRRPAGGLVEPTPNKFLQLVKRLLHYR